MLARPAAGEDRDAQAAAGAHWVGVVGVVGVVSGTVVVSVGGWTNRPTVIVTFVFGFAWVLPAGDCGDHVVVLGLVGRVRELDLDLEAGDLERRLGRGAVEVDHVGHRLRGRALGHASASRSRWSGCGVLPPGFWSTTMSAGWSESTSTRRTAKPAACSWAAAVS